MKLADIDLE